MKKLSVVIPVYNSEETLREVVGETIKTISGKYDYEIILVNDGSYDNVYEEIARMCQENKKIIGIDLSRNFGQHSAFMAGFNHVSGDIVMCLDDDGQTPPGEALTLLKELERGKDLVFAKWEPKKHSAFRNLGTYIHEIMMRVLLGKPKRIVVTSYFACRRFIIDELVRNQNPYPYVAGLLLRATRNISNVPVKHLERQQGVSGYTFKKLLSLWINGFTAFSVKPLRFATLSGSLFAMFGFVFGLVIVIRRLMNPIMVLGYSSIMATLLFMGGLIMIVLGMIGEYIGRIYISINNAPQYVIRSTINTEQTDENVKSTDENMKEVTNEK